MRLTKSTHLFYQLIFNSNLVLFNCVCILYRSNIFFPVIKHRNTKSSKSVLFNRWLMEIFELIKIVNYFLLTNTKDNFVLFRNRENNYMNYIFVDFVRSFYRRYKN